MINVEISFLGGMLYLVFDILYFVSCTLWDIYMCMCVGVFLRDPISLSLSVYMYMVFFLGASLVVKDVC